MCEHESNQFNSSLKNKSRSLLLYLVILSIGCHSDKNTIVDERPNVLFIAVDDLRPELGVYGNSIVKSPNIDRLAREGTLFTQHYVQVPTCGASRYSLMTGMRPSKIKHISNQAFYTEMANKKEQEKPESFVHQFRKSGYNTVGIGKLSHSVDGLVYGYNESPSKIKEMPHSWSKFVFDSGKWGTGWNAFFGYANGENRQSLKNQVKPYESADVDDEGYPDGLIAKSAIAELKLLKKNNKPFFLGVGFFKPHLPFNAPKKYWDLYNRSDIPIAPDPFIPENVNPASLQKMGEFNNYKLSDEKASLSKPLSDAYSQKLVHAYYAAVSYADAQIGRVIDELKNLELDKNTIVVIWGDHGWHLGNDRVWGKHTLFNIALKSALIIKVPGLKTKNSQVNSILETVDLYPTLLELCGVEQHHKVDGESFVDLIKIPDLSKRNVAYSYWKNGFSVKTERYRLSKYFRNQEPVVELFDHLLDPYENRNIAQIKTKEVEQLMPILKKGDNGFY